MKRLTPLLTAPLFGALIGLAALSDGQACSDVILNPVNTLKHQVVSARTMDFPRMDYWATALVKVPRGITWQSSDSTAQSGRTWTNQYGFVGEDFLGDTAKLLFGHRIFHDGMNEKGLSAALLWLEEGQFPVPDTTDPEGLLYLDLVGWILGQYETVAQVSAALRAAETHIVGNSLITGPAPLIFKLPVHFVVHDKDGKSLIAEWYPDLGTKQPRMHLYEGDDVDLVGVLTNDPNYEAQRHELANWDAITNHDAMANVPGGFDSVSRFIRLNKIRKFLDKPLDLGESGQDPVTVGAVAQALHAINNVDLGHGVDYDPFPGLESFGVYQETGVTLIRDHTNHALYFKGLHNQSLRKIDLNKIDFAATPLGATEYPSSSIRSDRNPTESTRYALATDITAQLAAPQYRYVHRAAADNSLDLNITVEVAVADQGKGGKYYIYAFDRDNNFWNWTGAKYGWKQVPRGSMLQCASGPLATTKFDGVFVGASTTRWEGLRIFAGYGTSPADMLLAGTVREVFMVETEVAW